MGLLPFFSAGLLWVSCWLRAEGPLVPSQSSGHHSTPAAVVLLDGVSPSAAQEAAARDAAERAGLSGQEVMARLVCSEALSTGFWRKACAWKSEEDLLQAIAWGIALRVRQARAKLDLQERSTSKAYYDVVFAPGQFRTSFAPKDRQHKSNPFARAFLAPERAQDYLNENGGKQKAGELFDSCRKIVERVSLAGSVPAPYGEITNFFYPASEVFGSIRPKWAPHAEASKNPGFLPLFEGPRPCVEFYNLKRRAR